MASIIDTHAHLCDPAFDAELNTVLERAKNAGVSAVIAVSENMADAEKTIVLATHYSMIRPAAGLYPTYLDIDSAVKMEGFIRSHKNELAAIGEVGLDYWAVQSEDEREIQREIFRRFIALSKELAIPINVHSRSAGRHVVAELLHAGAAQVQMHAFDGKASTAMPAVEAGYFFSIPPSVVRSEQKKKLVRQLPLSCLLLETDSPVLGPVPQERNEPANACISAKQIAELKDIPVESVIEAAWENTVRLYRRSFS